MRFLSILSALAVALLVVACATTANNTSNREPQPNGAFGDNREPDPYGGHKPGVTITENELSPEEEMRFGKYLDVMSFRGVTMPKLLARMDSKDREEWLLVRKKVHPAPRKPADWPPADEARMNEGQKAYRQWLLWPKLVRDRLLADDWDSEKSRQWFVRQGRLYELVYRFETETQRQSRSEEHERWNSFALAMRAVGDEGTEMLVSCMILRLGHDSGDVVSNAQTILTEIGEPAIQPLLDVLWIFQAGNLGFSKYVVATLAQMGRDAAGPTILELRHEKSARGGVTWRSRRFFVEVLGQIGDPRGVRAIIEEIEKTDITEYGADGKPDARKTAQAVFIFHEYCITALGKIGVAQGIAPVVALWEKDEDHMDGAAEALASIAQRMGVKYQRVQTLEEAKLFADKYKPKEKPKDG